MKYVLTSPDDGEHWHIEGSVRAPRVTLCGQDGWDWLTMLADEFPQKTCDSCKQFAASPTTNQPRSESAL